MKGSRLWIVLLLFTTALAPSSIASAADEPAKIAIITTSDLQSQVAPFSENPEEPSVGGIERISKAAKNVSTTSDATFIFSSGDDLIGPFYDIFNGEPEMTAMTMAGYSAACPGNHEFDFGWPTYLNTTKYAGFPIVSANLEIDDPELRAAIPPSVILEDAGLRFGVFGLMTPDLLKIASTGEGISVNPDYLEISKNQIKDFKDNGCDLIILLSHMGSRFDCELAENLSGIDLIIGGHDHIYFNATVEGPGGWETIIVQDGMEGERLGVLRFNYSGKGIQNPQWDTVLLDESAGTDTEIKEYLAPFLNLYDEKLSLEIGLSAIDLNAAKKDLRSREMPLGNLITDAWLDWFPHADIAAINGGSIRGDRIYPKGPISYQTLSTILPFKDDIFALKMYGREIKQMLEVSASALGPEDYGVPSGAFLQVGGLQFEIDIEGDPYTATYDGKQLVEIINPGSRIHNISVEKNGTLEPLDDDLEYMVLVNNWIAQGGDGYALVQGLPDDRKQDTTVIDKDPVAAYIKKNSPVSPEIEGRIKIIDATSAI
jgi:5'-nucleotidase/UDP-sugar diphosphatase